MAEREFSDFCPTCKYRPVPAGNAPCRNCFYDRTIGSTMNNPSAYIYSATGEDSESFVSTYTIKDSGERTEFDTGAVRDMHVGKGRMDLLPWRAIIEVSKHCENGAAKYGEHNVDKGIPLHSLLDSGIRHTAKFIVGEEDEPHLTAAVWNFLWALEMKLSRDDMCDIPWKAEE